MVSDSGDRNIAINGFTYYSEYFKCNSAFYIYNFLIALMKEKNKILETHLVIATALVIIFLFKQKMLFIYLAVGIGVTGIFIKPLAELITKGWFGLALFLSKISSTIIMTIVYFLILVPIATIYKLSNKRLLDLKNPGTSMWHKRNHQYDKNDLDNTW